MTIHMIRLQTERNATLRQYLTTWLTTHEAWSGADNQPPTNRETHTGAQYMAADWRFAWGSNSKLVLLDNLVSYSRAYAGWGVIGAHACDHDDATPDACPALDYGLPDGFGQNIKSGVWGSVPSALDPR